VFVPVLRVVSYRSNNRATPIMAYILANWSSQISAFLHGLKLLPSQYENCTFLPSSQKYSFPAFANRQGTICWIRRVTFVTLFRKIGSLMNERADCFFDY